MAHLIYTLGVAAGTSGTVMDTPKASWQERERARFAGAKYKPVPWADAEWVHKVGPVSEHFVHVSEKDPYMLAYTPSAADGERDRRVPIKPGRYLQKFYADRLTAEQIAKLAGEVRGSGLKVEFTTDLRTMQAVYASHGLSACMSYSVGHYMGSKFNGGLHPLAAYAGGDLKLAFSKAREGHVSARALVWPERKVYSRAYGDTEALRKALDADGWASGLLDGARIQAIPLVEAAYNCYRKSAMGPHFSGPYVDHIKWARYDAKDGSLRLQATATGATHSVQHGDGIIYPIDVAPQRPAGATGESIAAEHKRLCTMEAGQPAPKPEPHQTGLTVAELTAAILQRRALDGIWEGLINEGFAAANAAIHERNGR